MNPREALDSPPSPPPVAAHLLWTQTRQGAGLQVVSDGHLMASAFGLCVDALLFVRAKKVVLILCFRQSTFL